jgi:tetratricopeptide (TPR) repeat protein
LHTLQFLSALIRLLRALFTGKVKWPGPRIYNLDPNASVVEGQIEIKYQNLFSSFIFNTSGVIGAFSFWLLMFLSNTSLLSGYIRINGSWELFILTVVVLTGGNIGVTNAHNDMAKVNIVLFNLNKKVEPRGMDDQSAESEYAIEHPLVEHQFECSDYAKAFTLFNVSTKYSQIGKLRQALMIYQESTKIDPSLHDHAREALSKMAQECNPKDAGPIYYWLGAHSEYLTDLKQAAAWYEKAIDAFRQIGYQKRESRAHCNLGNVKMHMREASAAMEEFEKAVILNPRNGTAYLNIANAYYGICDPEDDNYERALDAFANAIAADPPRYGPMVIASLRKIGYTWQEDLEKITQRVESKH